MIESTTGRRDERSDLVIRKEDGLLTTTVAGELLAMSVQDGVCFGFNGVATRIWELLAEPRSLDDLCETLLREYEVGEGDCRSDVTELIEKWRAEGLVSVRAA